MSALTTTALASALDTLETELSDTAQRPRNEEELITRVEELMGHALVQSPNRLYVPDAEAPINPSEKDDHITGPGSALDPQTRALSARAKGLVTNLISFVAETQTISAGLTAAIAGANARLTAAQALVSSSRLQWMRQTDRFLDLSHIDASSSTSIVVDTITGNGVSLAPIRNQDLTANIQQLSLIQSRSGIGLPGDNLELSSLQGSPGASTPAAGSSTALTTTRQDVGSSGGTGQEPTVSFAGVPDLHANLSAVVSSQTEAWFDWEVIYVPPVQKCAVHGTAYVADETTGSDVDITAVTKGYGWNASVQNPDGTTRTSKLAYFSSVPPVVGRDGPASNLTLALEMDMGQAVPLTQLSITVRQVGGLWPTITGVDVSLNHNQWVPLRVQGNALTWQGAAAAAAATTNQINSGGTTTAASGGSVRGTSLWEIPSYASVDPNVGLPTFRYIAVTFAQPDSYVCPKGIGHPYYTKVTKTTKDSKALFGLIHHHNEDTQTERLPTPATLIGVAVGVTGNSTNNPGGSIGNILGVAASAGLGATFGGPLVKAVGGIGTLVSGIVSGLIGSSSKKTEILQEGEYTDVFQAFRQCISVGQIIPLSRTYSVSQPGQLVSAPINYGHPFSAVRLLVDQRQGNNTAITYDVSIDGQTWLPITPMDLSQPPPPNLTGSPVYTVDLQGQYNSVQYRATFSTTEAHTAPRLLGISIEALPV